MDMTFLEEVRSYSDEDLELILATQEDLYTEDEMRMLKEEKRLRERRAEEEREAYIAAHTPATILCDKCEGPNAFENTHCQYCGNRLNKEAYYTVPTQTDEVCEKPRQKNPYISHYLISFLIPLVGFIVGAIFLTSDEEKKQSCGKVCAFIGLLGAVCDLLLIQYWIQNMFRVSWF